MALFKTGGIVYTEVYDVTVVNSTYPDNVPNQSISYNFTNPNYKINNGIKRMWFESSNNTLDLLYQPDLYDYYLYVTLSSASMSNFSFTPDSMHILSRLGNETTTYQLSDMLLMEYNNPSATGFTACGKLPSLDVSSFNGFYFIDTSGGTVGSNIVLEGIFILVPKDSTQEQLQGVISAINSQTSSLGGKLDGIDSSVDKAADDVQQSIEDQYSGDPETEFSVDDVITQHNEKMGVLSFGSDVMLQFLDMFQSANVGTAELTLPGFNITVENVEYSVWPDYSFNFEQLNDWVPALMSVIRVMLPAFVWLMVLRYCIKVFEDNFLAK